MIFFAYTIFIHLFHAGMRAAGIFSDKIRKTATGQKKSFEFIKISPPPFPGKEVVWMHCASLGEFEQGRSILEKLKSRRPDIKIALSFFSSSGYEIRSRWSGADYIFYLPKDSPSRAKKLIQWLNPSVLVLVKYDFWWNYLRVLHQAGIPVYLVAAHFNKKKYYFYQPFARLINSWKQIYAMRHASEKFMNSLGYTNVKTVGDPRLDRVISIRQQGIIIPEKLREILEKQDRIFVYGSVYPEDMDILLPSIQQRKEVFHVVVPHDVQSSSIHQITEKLTGSYDQYSKGLSGKNICIIDEVGYLAGIYSRAFLAYIGGGFGRGIHNILEPAVYGIPVLFGPKFSSFPEAFELIAEGSCFSVDTPDSFEFMVSSLEKTAPPKRNSINKMPEYFQRHAGASDKIISDILEDNFPE